MSSITYFNQSCPVCGRTLQVFVELLGQTVMCRHCRGRFLARGWHLDVSLLDRAEELLAMPTRFRKGIRKTSAVGTS